jgi:hypothetical protein
MSEGFESVPATGPGNKKESKENEWQLLPQLTSQARL